MRTVNEWTMVAASALWLSLTTCRVDAQATAPVQARNVVLVHGAWADGSSWGEVIARLQTSGRSWMRQFRLTSSAFWQTE